MLRGCLWSGMWSKPLHAESKCGSQACQESIGLTAIFENDHIDTFCIIQQLIIISAVLSIENQNVAVKGGLLGIEMLNTVATHIRPHLAEVSKRSFGDPGQAENRGEIKKENCIAILKSMGNGAVEVTINNPLRLFQFTLQDGIKFAAGKMFPVSTPIELSCMISWVISLM